MKKYASFKEWSQSGYLINKGAKAVFRENGIPMFTEDQVIPKTVRKISIPSWSPCNPEQEEASEFAEIYGDDAYAFGADF